MKQIEQFIETVFPSQKSGLKGGTKSAEELQRQKNEAGLQAQEIFFVALAVIAALVVCGGSMVRVTANNDFMKEY
jgi:hypothetical protein